MLWAATLAVQKPSADVYCVRKLKRKNFREIHITYAVTCSFKIKKNSQTQKFTIPKLWEMRNTIVKTLICSQERICANMYGNIMYITRFDSKVGEGLR